MQRTLIHQKRSIEKYLDEQLEFAKDIDEDLRKKFPDEAKNVDKDDWFKSGSNANLMKRKGVMEALLWMNPDVNIYWDAEGKHTICGFDIEADCDDNCEHYDTNLCRNCKYHNQNKPSYYKTELRDGTTWDEYED